MGRVVPEYADDQTREIIVGSYRVIYRYDTARNLVRVSTVYHGSQALPPVQPE